MKINYKTEQKELIKKYLIENDNKFVSVEEILKYMSLNNQKVGLTTIYRFLNYLEKNEQVRVESKDNKKFYQLIKNECENHFHLKCKRCGKTVHLDCEEFEKVSMHIKQHHKFNLDHNTIIYGVCNNCSN